jgi:hypothetical protein
MMSMPPKRTIGVHEQAALLKFHCPRFKTRVRGGTLVAVGEVQPDPLFHTYTVEITYAVGSPPEVRVRSPKLEARDGCDTIPHMYGQERLCLYLPNTGEWSSKKPLAMTIVPWTAVWLHYYEVWRATGEWLGGGEEPGESVTYRREQTDA